jgi:rhodanese-related sulfurtransferase
MDERRVHLQELDPTQETVVYCRVGLRAYLAARILLQHGFTNVFNLTGGLLSYPSPVSKN